MGKIQTYSLFIISIFILILQIAIPQDQSNIDTSSTFYDNAEMSSIEIATDPGTRAAGYEYHNYTQMVEKLQELNASYPNLMELNTAQDLFGLPNCRDGYNIWIVRITNESITTPKPEVLYVGGHHGNEQISVEVPFYYITWLLENYQSDTNIRFIIDHRDLYIIPALNPYGWENDIRFDGNGEDVNRDYPYGNASTNDALTTVGARAVHELMKAHMFTAGISWHSGDECIYYAWGSPLHNTPLDESPDDSAFEAVAERLSNFAGGSPSSYIYGPANQVIYEASGAWSDYAYAASWDPAGIDPAYPTEGARMLAFGVEISHEKKPPISALGTTVDLYASPDEVSGYIPRNIRMGYAIAELAEPYVKFSNQSQIPKSAGSGENINLSWEVGGAVTVDQTNVQFGKDENPKLNYDNVSDNLSGKINQISRSFKQKITMPEEVGTYYFIVRARVDQNYRSQYLPEPDYEPQSIYANYRTNASWEITNDGNTIRGQVDWYSEVIAIEVVFQEPPKIKFLEYPTEGEIGDNATFRWSVNGTDTIIKQSVYRSLNQYKIFDFDKFDKAINMVRKTKNGTEYMFETNLPSSWGNYYYIIEVEVNETIKIYSDIITVLVKPITEIINLTNPVFVREPLILDWSFHGAKEMSVVSIQFDPVPDDDFFENGYISFSYGPITEGGSAGFGFFLPDIGGEYKVRVISKCIDIITREEYTFFTKWSELTVLDKIIVTRPIINYDSANSTVTITGISATCSNRSHSNMTPENVITARIMIYDNSSNMVHEDDLLWSGLHWYYNLTDVRNWTEDRYYAIAKFNDGIHSGESTHYENDSSEFEIIHPEELIDPTESEEEEKSEFDETQLILYIVATLILFVIIAVVLILKRSPEQPRKD